MKLTACGAARLSRPLVIVGLLWLGVLGGGAVAQAQTPAPVFTEIPNSPFVTDQSGVLTQPHDVAFSPDGKLLASANYATDTVTVFSVAPGGQLTEVGAPISSGGGGPNWLGFSPSGNLLAIVNAESNNVVMFHVGANGTLTPVGPPTTPGPGVAYWGAFSPDGALLAVANANFAGTGSVSMFHVDLTNGTLTPVTNSPFDTGGNGTQSVAFTRGGTLLAAANRLSGTVTMFDVGPQGQLSRIGLPVSAGGAGFAWAMATNPAGGLLVTANQYSSISVFHVDLAHGTLSTPRVVEIGATSGPRGVDFSPGGTLLATANFGNPFGATEPPPANTASVFSVLPDGTLVEVPGSPFASGPGNKHSVFSPNGSLFATANYLGDNVSVFRSAPVEIRKTVAGTFAPGGTITYTVTVHNGTLVPVAGPVVIDDLSGVLDKARLVSTMASHGTVSVDQSTQILTWTGSLGPDETVTVHYTFRIHDHARGLLHDGLMGPPDATCTSNAGGMLGPECVVVTPIVPPPAPGADLEVSKTPSADTIHPGGQVQFTLVVRNNGPHDATGVTLEDPVPPGLSLDLAQPSQGSCAVTPGEQLRCGLGDLPAGGQALVLVTATANLNATGVLVNEAAVFGDQGDPNPGNNTATARVTVVPLPPPPTPDPGPQPVSDLVITKHVNHARALVGQKLTYTITVVNRRPGDAAADVHVTDTSRLPLKVDSITPSHGSCQPTTPFRCALGTVRPGARVTITITVTARKAGLQINAAAVTTSSWQADPRLARAATLVRRRPPPPPPPRVTG